MIVYREKTPFDRLAADPANFYLANHLRPLLPFHTRAHCSPLQASPKVVGPSLRYSKWADTHVGAVRLSGLTTTGRWKVTSERLRPGDDRLPRCESIVVATL